uniref:Uncharacterized protein n=1 Tax=Anguilla anguilla TaxID=7936 RepID=A0A0E9WIY3_ANGAN
MNFSLLFKKVKLKKLRGPRYSISFFSVM